MQPQSREVSPQREGCEIWVCHADDAEQAEQAKSVGSCLLAWWGLATSTDLLLRHLLLLTGCTAWRRLQTPIACQQSCCSVAFGASGTLFASQAGCFLLNTPQDNTASVLVTV